MNFLQMPVQPLWKGKRTSLAPFDSAGKQPFMSGKVFPHGLDEVENLAASWTCEILDRRCWAMFGLEVSDQCLFGGVSLAACLAPVPLLLSTGSPMKVRHSSGGENLATATARPTCLPGVSLHVVFKTPGALKALVTKLALPFPSLNFENFERDILTGGPSAHPTLFPTRISLSIPSALLRSFLFTRIVPSSSGTAGVAVSEGAAELDFAVEDSGKDGAGF